MLDLNSIKPSIDREPPMRTIDRSIDLSIAFRSLRLLGILQIWFVLLYIHFFGWSVLLLVLVLHVLCVCFSLFLSRSLVTR